MPIGGLHDLVFFLDLSCRFLSNKRMLSLQDDLASFFSTRAQCLLSGHDRFRWTQPVGFDFEIRALRLSDER